MPVYYTPRKTLIPRVKRAFMGRLLKTYEQLVLAGRPLLNLLLAHRANRGKEDPARVEERRGMASRPRPSGPLVWIHAASVGEVQSAQILLHALESHLNGGVHVLVTTGTTASAALMSTRLPAFAFHQYVPLDHPGWVKKFLDHWKPDLALWMESELWPNILSALKTRGIPCILVNARLSEKSYTGWRRARGLARDILSSFTLILAQTQTDADRYKDLGAPLVHVTDNLKYSAKPLPVDPVSLAALKLCTDSRPLWVFASTHAGEESLACRIHKTLRTDFPDLLTIIVPRHPSRRDDIAGLCFEEEVKFRLRGDTHALPTNEDDIYIADTMGELGLFYSLSPIAVIGRSFSDDGGGGHNPVEAAILGCAILTGPNNQFQRQIYDDMLSADAVIETRDEESLTNALRDLLTHAEKPTMLEHRAMALAQRKSHVIDTVMKEIIPYLHKMRDRHAA